MMTLVLCASLMPMAFALVLDGLHRRAGRARSGS